MSLLPKLFWVVLIQLGICQNLMSQSLSEMKRMYLKGFETIQSTEEYKDYMVWAGEEVPYISDEILYSSELLFNCPKCNELVSEGNGVKTTIDTILDQEPRDIFKAILFFTEMRNNCFSIILRTTYNNETGYEDGIFIGKQVYFQFSLQESEPKLCLKMSLKND